MKIDNSFALAVSLAIAASLTATMTQVRAEGDASSTVISLAQMKNVKVNTSLTRAKLQTMSADSVLKLNSEGKIQLTATELKEVKGLVGKKNPKLDARAYSTVMCPW